MRISAEELRLIELVGRGWTDDRIARRLEVSRTTVRRRIRDLSTRLGATSRVTLIVRAVQEDAVDCERMRGWQTEGRRPI